MGFGNEVKVIMVPWKRDRQCPISRLSQADRDFVDFPTFTRELLNSTDCRPIKLSSYLRKEFKTDNW